MHANFEIMQRAALGGTIASDVAADRDNIVVLHGVSWAQYDVFSRARGEAPRPRMAYLDGELELMSTSQRHEIEKKVIARLVEAFCEERGISLNGLGSTTYRKKAKAAGLEPDECYWIGASKRVPDLAIEVVHTSGGVDMLEIYRRLGVGEVWFWLDGSFWTYGLVDRAYVERASSEAILGIDLHDVARIVLATKHDRQTEAVRAYRKSLGLRRRSSSGSSRKARRSRGNVM